MSKTLKELKVEAEGLGIDVPGNISKVKLEAKVTAVRDVINAPVDNPESEVITKKLTPKAQAKKDGGKLMRVRITCHDPQFKKYPGLVRAAGSTLYFVKRYVPFNRITQVEKVIYDFMKQTEYQWFEEKINRTTGRKYKVPRSSPAFVIEDLPQLTPTELEELAKDQTARGALDDD